MKKCGRKKRLERMYRKERRRKRWEMGEMWKKEGRLEGVGRE